MNYKPGEILGGKYKIIDALGGGAMGKLFKAENISLHKPVAIKVMHGDFAQKEEYQQRFMQEACSAASLEHINICTIIDYDVTEDGDAYIVMELLTGETLSERLERVGALGPMSACLIMRQLLSALNCAHAKGIVHRDIKPDNVFLVHYEDRDDFVKLIDFGVAHIEHPEAVGVQRLTQSGQVYGTPQYLSPEQANGEEIDYRADLYAAGVIFYEMLVGEPPFNGKSCLELLLKQVNEPAPHLPATISQSERLDAIIQRLLAKKPADRFDSGLEVTHLLDEIILLLSNDGPRLSSSNISLTLNLQKLSGEHAAAPTKLNNKWVVWGLVAGIVVVLIVIGLCIGLGAFGGAQDDSLDEITFDEEDVDFGLTPGVYNVTDENFSISKDPILAEDTRLVAASEAYWSGEYEASFKVLDELKEKYWEHPNFVRLYLLSSTASRNNTNAFSAFAQLLAIEPMAVFNPAVARLADKRFSSEEDAKELGNVIVNNQGMYSKTGMAWLIIRSRYDYDENRINRMIDVFDRLNNVYIKGNNEKFETPAWMMRSVNIWRLSKKDCARRLELLTQLEQMTESRDDIYKNILIPLFNQHSKECFVRRSSADCNACLRSWLDNVVYAYEGIEPPAEDIQDALTDAETTDEQTDAPDAPDPAQQEDGADSDTPDSVQQEDGADSGTPDSAQQAGNSDPHAEKHNIPSHKPVPSGDEPEVPTSEPEPSVAEPEVPTPEPEPSVDEPEVPTPEPEPEPEPSVVDSAAPTPESVLPDDGADE